MRVPAHFDAARVGEVWRVPYQDRAREAAELGLRPAREDRRRVALLAVDMQNTFCTPGFELFVPGAPDDTHRLCEFIYRNLDGITQILPSLDTHHAMQVFHAMWLVDEAGNHPDPYTLVSADDVAAGRWRLDPAVTAEFGIGDRHLADYTRRLAAGGKYDLTVWPYHAMLGGIGHALVSAFEEAVFFHGVARASRPDFQVKGDNSLTEHYSMIGPEVTEGPDGEPIGGRNEALIAKLDEFDAVLIAGQAKSHCVAWTVEDLLASAPSLAHRTYLLEDCTSPVMVPGMVDYTAEANAAFERFRAAGVRVVRSTEFTV
jgi:nicotinamidase-related amidase